ncbi:hypothetical protein T4B_4009 [Trichinella pseudospiralis]|uniref:Uncharacterized protein n=1 Tax=Trichinella pseudospiralis TaxID=6337 RepID=A0A0V1GKL4_TRIPS|nr:hypothetical protein T4B_4009 [Trichinella pseudospiralis]
MNCPLNGRRVKFEETKRFVRVVHRFQKVLLKEELSEADEAYTVFNRVIPISYEYFSRKRINEKLYLEWIRTMYNPILRRPSKSYIYAV